MTEYRVKAEQLGEWTGFKLRSPEGNTIDKVRRSGPNVIVTTRTSVDSGAREATVSLRADLEVSVFGPEIVGSERN